MTNCGESFRATPGSAWCVGRSFCAWHS